jgi:hypothetical protein
MGPPLHPRAHGGAHHGIQSNDTTSPGKIKTSRCVRFGRISLRDRNLFGYVELA